MRRRRLKLTPTTMVALRRIRRQEGGSTCPGLTTAEDAGAVAEERRERVEALLDLPRNALPTPTANSKGQLCFGFNYRRGSLSLSIVAY